MFDFIKQIISKFVSSKKMTIEYKNGEYSVKGWLLTKQEKEKILNDFLKVQLGNELKVTFQEND
jgi:hypothetical protein